MTVFLFYLKVCHESINPKNQKENQIGLYPTPYQILKMQQLLLKEKPFLKPLRNTSFHKLLFSLFSKDFFLTQNQELLEVCSLRHKQKLKTIKLKNIGRKKYLEVDWDNKMLEKPPLLSLLQKLKSNFALAFSFPFLICSYYHRIPKRNSTAKIIKPLKIKAIPKITLDAEVSKINSANFPPVYAITPNIINIKGTPYTNILKKIPATILIHLSFVFSSQLKTLWASLSSKAQLLGCVFDTPDGDALPITYGGAL